MTGNVCNLKKNPDGKGYTAESIRELRKLIGKKFYEAQDIAANSDDFSRTSKRLIKKALQEIGDQYNNVYLSEIVKQVEDILKNEFPVWYEGGYLPEQGLRNVISKRARQNIVEQPEFRETVDDDDSNMPSYFLDKVYGTKAVLKNEIKQEVTQMLLHDFIVDRVNGKLVTTITDANKNVRNRKNEMFYNVITTLANNKDHEIIDSLDLNLYDDEGNYTGIFENVAVRDIFYRRRTFDTFDGQDIQQLADAAYTDPNKAAEYRAFKDWFTLTHYDDFVNLLLGEAIITNPATKNKFASGDNYMFADKSTATITSWRPDDGQVFLQEEVNALAQSLVNSTPYYEFGSNNPTKASNGHQLYLKFEDFYRVITKLKDAIYQPNAALRVDDIQGIYGEGYVSLTPEEKQLVQGQSLRQLINKIRLNPQVYGKLVFKIIVKSANSDATGSQTISNLGFSNQDISKVWSIYKGFFEDDNNKGSLAFIQQQYDHNVQNYYALMTQVMDSMFSVNYLQFYDDDGNIVVRTLKEQGADETRRAIEDNIYNTNSRRITKDTFERLQMTPYKAKPIYTKNVETGKDELLSGIEFEIDDYNIKYTITSTIISKNGVEIDGQDRETFAKSDKVKNFIEKQLCINLTNNKAYQDALETIYGVYGTPYTDLLRLANEVYFNRYLSNIVLKNIQNYRDTKMILDQVYQAAIEKAPKFNTKFHEIKLISDSSIPILEKMAQVHTLATGQATSSQVRDADGNLLSQQTLSRLLGYLPSQWDMIKDYQDKLNYDQALAGFNIDTGETDAYIFNNFSIFKDRMYLGHSTMKELRSPLGNKPLTQFTVAELMQATFLHTFVGGFTNDSRKFFSDFKVGLLPSVNSDKNTIGQAIFNLKLTCERFKKAYHELTPDEIAILISEELGDSYEMTMMAIQQDFDRLAQYVKSIYPEIIFDPQNNFELFNAWVSRHPEKSAEQWLFEWTRDYNHTNPTNPIKLTENVHYQRTKGAGIKTNGTLQTLRERYSSQQNVKKFMNKKKTEMFMSLLNEGFKINLYSGENQTVAANYLRDQFQDWVHHGNMTLGKLTYKGKTYNISSKVDLQEFERQTGLDLTTNIHSVLNIPGLIFEIHPMLDKYNSLDYLFTQEFMIAGVGSHIAHSSKSKNNTTIIWGHPAIGKTFSKNGKYGDKYIDWDDEFNRKRDAWIAKHSGTVVGTTEFKAARNEYLINWAQHEDFKDFVKQEWKRVKNKANQQNKILLASPAMLLSLFPNDFNKVITMSDEDFIARGLARGDSNPAAWKQGINARLQFIPDTKKIQIQPGQYLEDLFDNGTFAIEFEQLEDNFIREEASRFLAQHKRNVSYTAAMHEYQLGQITGIPSEYNMAMMQDVPAWVYTMAGDMKDDADSFDGATFVNPWVIEWENNSLNGAKAGIDKKPFVHFYDERTRTGGIIKTAGFGVTNDRVRNDKFYRNMIFNMTHRPWYTEDGKPLHVTGKGILEDFNGKNVDYGSFYFMKDRKYYIRTVDAFVESQQGYQVTDYEVDDAGNIIEDKPLKSIIKVSSNYQVWKMFGGHNSMEVVDGKLQPSEHSRILTAIACNNYGFKKPGAGKYAQTANEVYQPMKHSDIHYMPTSGAVKQGIGNVNGYNNFFRKVVAADGYSNLNFMKVRMLQAGIQLDKEHHADNSVLSLMTQVISAACAKGFMVEDSENLYTALYELSKLGTKHFRDELGKLNIGVKGEQAFKNAATRIILDTVMKSSSADGDMMVAIANKIMREMRVSRNFSFTTERLNKANEIIPCSSPEIFRKVISSLSSALTKKGIKAKMPGILSVLCPTHGIVKFYKVPVTNEKGITTIRRVNYYELEKLYGNEENIEAKLDELQAAEPIIQNVTDIELGFNYLVQTANGPAVYKVVKPNRTQNIKQKEINSYGLPVYEVGYQDIKNALAVGTISNIQEYIKDGQDLRSYNVRFIAGGQSYQMADLDIVQDYFGVKEIEDPQQRLNQVVRLAIKYGTFEELCNRLQKLYNNNSNNGTIFKRDIDAAIDTLRRNKDYYANGGDVAVIKDIQPALNKLGQGMLNRIMQLQLNAISPSSDNVIVTIGGQKLEVDKSTINIQSYGCIMPKVFKTNFGLEQFDNIEEIKADPDFFLKRLVKNANTKVENIPVLDENDKLDHYIANFHLELKKLDGKHIYIRNGTKDANLGAKVNWIPRKEADGKVYRVDGRGEVIYPMFSEDDEIYLDDEGNEIIVTKDVEPVFKDDTDNVVPFKNVKYSKEIEQYIDTTTKKPVTLEKNSGIQFYLDNFDYFTININYAADDANFQNIVNRASISRNRTARRVSGLLKGKIEEKRKKAIKLNNYDKILDDNSGDFQHLRDEANRMRTSFLRSLKILAARIPAQSQQSFMSMQVEAFSNPDINSAYVSIFQFYLQGSDLDIDAVSMQTYDIDDDGLLQGHSPYYSLETEDMRKASEELPFPNDQKLSTIEIDNIEESSLARLFIEGYIGNEYSNRVLQIYKERLNNNPVEVRLNLSSPVQIRQLARLIKMFSKDKVFKLCSDAICPNMIAILNKKELFPGMQEGEVLLGKNNKNGNDIRYIEESIIRIINNHNKYLSEANPKKRESIIKNYATTQLFNIIEDPINRLQADSSVDVVTGPVKNLAKSSPKATVQNDFTPGNVVNKYQSIVENMVGKDGIAICATGLKSFFALTELYQLMLKDGKADDLLFDVKIAGKHYNGLSNGFIKDYINLYELTEDQLVNSDGSKKTFNQQFSTKLQDYLFEQLWESDAANNMSAFLGLSADNAKELILAKVNAGTAIMGLYLYGLSIGVPINELYRILTSPLAFRITELTKGDLFNGETGVNGVLGALKYMREEPTDISKYDDVKILSDIKYDKPSKVLSDLINKEILGKSNENDFVKDPLSQISKILYEAYKEEKEQNLPGYAQKILNDIIDKFRQIRQIGLNEYRNTFSGYNNDIKQASDLNLLQSKFNQAVDQTLSYISDLALSRIDTYKKNYFGKSDIFLDIDKLAIGADEFKLLGKILRVNQEVKTNPYELIQQVANVENCIIDRINKIKSFNRRHSGESSITAKYLGVNMLAIKDPQTLNDMYKVDIDRFFAEEGYAQEKIAQYDAVMQSFNPLRVIHDVPHYRGYWETVYCAAKGAQMLSVKQRILATKIPAFIKRAAIYDQRMIEQVSKNAENALDTYFRRQWMLDKKFSITLPASIDTDEVYVFVDNTSHAVLNNHDRQIILGTPLGDANFKRWVEHNLIPQLKKKNNLKDNKFIRDINPIINTNTQLGVISINYGLAINMMPDKGDEYGQDLVREYREAFNQLASADLIPISRNKSMALRDIFYLYSLISNNGRVGRRSLHGIMQDFDGQIVDSFRESIAQQDIKLTDESSPEYQKIVSILSDEVLAPFSTPSRGGSNIFKFKEKNSDAITLYEKASNNDNDNFEEQMEYEYNPMFDEGFDSVGYKNENGYKIVGQANMLTGSDYNYFTFPENIVPGEQMLFKGGFATLQQRKDGSYNLADITFDDLSEVAKEKLKIENKDKNPADKIVINAKTISARKYKLEQEFKTKIKEEIGSNFPLITIMDQDGKPIQVPDIGEIERLLNKYKNCS